MTRRAPTSYRLVLPPPWVQVPLRSGTRERVRQLVDVMSRDVPADVPPDQLGPIKREIEERLVRDLARSREYGGLHHYFPLGPMHGLHLGASFVVSEVSPPLPPDQPMDESLAHEAMAELVADGGTIEVVGSTTWVRHEEVVQPDAEQSDQVEVPTRRVTYTSSVPGDPTTWILVAFSSVGDADGDPDGELARVTVSLFDAIMSTWRWNLPEAEQ